MGCTPVHDHLEAEPLNLGTEHFPFPCTLRELVQDRYDDSPAPVNSANTMSVDELLGYLENVDNFDLSPWMGVLTQTEAMGDPALPSKEQSAVLLWLGQALEQWEKNFPLEEPLAALVKQIKPVAAALAVVDASFLQPGAHPVHQLLDAIQARAVGWQPDLDRVAAILEQQVTKAVEGSREWFENRDADIEEVCSQFLTAAERDSARAKRMIQRVVETELGKVKTAAAKVEAARMINELLETYEAPAEIGEFLTGPWYSSAQLVLLKFSQDSEQWQQMSETTHTLIDSLQNLDAADEERKQRIMEVVTRLPKEMRRWLLSLHHDTEAVNEAMGLVEFAHLRVLRNQALKTQRIAPIEVASDPALSGSAEPTGITLECAEGQWFRISSPGESDLRVQLVLKVEREEQLLFANMAGIKVLQMGFAQFKALSDEGNVTRLDYGASFSRCLAQAAGIKSEAMLDALAKTQGAPENWRDANNPARPEPPRKPELELVSSQPEPVAPKSEPEEQAAQSPVQAVPTPSPQEDDLANEATLDINASQSDEQAFLDMLDDELLDDFGQEVPEQDAVSGDPEPAPTSDLDMQVESPADSGFLGEQASDTSEDDAGGDSAAELTGTSAPTAASGEGFLLDQSQQLGDQGLGNLSDDNETLSAADPGASPDPVPESSMEPTAADEPAPDPVDGDTEPLDLPSGTWLGFHDGETPLMARLAVHDPDEDTYIFVNRKGVKLRTASGAELRSLMEQGLVDILETKSNFRDEVQKAREDDDS